jgi:hypothetical protein
MALVWSRPVTVGADLGAAEAGPFGIARAAVIGWVPSDPGRGRVGEGHHTPGKARSSKELSAEGWPKRTKCGGAGAMRHLGYLPSEGAIPSSGPVVAATVRRPALDRPSTA